MTDRPPLVLLHAFPLDARLFDDVRDPIGAGVDLYTPDLRGFGTGPTLGEHTEPDLGVLAEDLGELMDIAGLDAAVIGGVSLGGYVALEFARRYPARVAGLVLADTRSGPDTPEASGRRHAVAARADRGDVASGSDAIAPLVAPDAAAPVRMRLAAIADDVPAATIAWAQRAMAARADTTAVLTGLRVPALVIVGEHDAITPPDVARAMVDAVTGAGGTADYVELPGAGHLTPAEDPAGFAAAVLDWRQRLPGAGSAP